MIDIVNLDVGERFVPYEEAWALQRTVHAEVAAGERGDTLLLLEHPDTFTAGTATTAADRPIGKTPVVDVDRGGKITWHGPGQLVGYPILRVPKTCGVVDYVRLLEEALLNAVAAWGITGHLVRGRSGIWVTGAHADDKIAQIGVRVSRHVTMHGFSLNLNNDMAGFAQITPCGITDAGVTTVSHLLGRTFTPKDSIPAIVKAFTPFTLDGPAPTLTTAPLILKDVLA